MYASKQQLLAILPELELIQEDTGLKINRAKDLQQILNIYNRQVTEYKRQKPGENIIEKKNKVSLYCTMKCFKRINQFS